MLLSHPQLQVLPFCLCTILILALGSFPAQQGSCAGSRQKESFLQKQYFLPSFQINQFNSVLIISNVHQYDLTDCKYFEYLLYFIFVFYRNGLKPICIANASCVFSTVSLFVVCLVVVSPGKKDHGSMNCLPLRKNGQPQHEIEVCTVQSPVLIQSVLRFKDSFIPPFFCVPISVS